MFPADACALIDWLLTVRTDERATIEDVANHWWVNWGYEESVCDCPSSPHQDCPSPLLARYTDWQNWAGAAANMTVDPETLDFSCSDAFYFSLPLKSDCGGVGRTRGGISNLRKSRKENVIPQNSLGACGGLCSTAVSSISTSDRRKPKSIVKHQRSLDSVFHNPKNENSSSQQCSTLPQTHQAQTLPHTHTNNLSKSLPHPSAFSQPSSKMPKKGILKNLYVGETGYSTKGKGSDVEVKDSDLGKPCSYKQHTSFPAAEDSPTMHTEAVRRRKGILKRNGKFSRSLDLPENHNPSPCPALAMFPEALQQLLQATSNTEGRHSRPSSVVSEDSLFSSDSFDLLDLSIQSQQNIFSEGIQHIVCSSEENLEQTRTETIRAGENKNGQKEMNR